MKILIATKNPTKIEGAKRAFKHFYDDVEVVGVKVSSDVSEEPVGDEIYEGAKNRIKNLKEYANKVGIDADYYISIESGITNSLKEWVIVNIAMIEDKNGKTSFGTSPGLPVPDKYVDEIITTDLGQVMDKIFNTNDLRRKQGGIGLLTKGVVTRYDLTEQAFIMALTKFINGDIWR